MSLDYPDYVELKKRSRWLALLWSVGDIGYYFGLFGAVIAPVSFFLLHWIRGDERMSFLRTSGFAALLFAAFVLLFYLSIAFKAYARKRGGINSN